MPGSKRASMSRRKFLRGAAGVAAGTVAAELLALGIDTRAMAARGALLRIALVQAGRVR